MTQYIIRGHVVLISISQNFLRGVVESASPEEITAAYRDLAKIHHPDKGLDDQADMFYSVIYIYIYICMYSLYMFLGDFI